MSDCDSPVDPRSESNISTLHPRVQPVALRLVHAAKDAGIEVRVISGTRTYEQQNDLYEQGRTRPGKKVTNARGGYSNHNFGLAFDIGVFAGSKYMDESPLYAVVGGIGKRLGLAWGGDWHFTDEPHFELRPEWAETLTESEMLSGLRDRHARNEDAFA